MFQNILIGYEGSPGAREALKNASRFAKKLSARLTVLSVREPYPHYTNLPGESEDATEAQTNFFEARKNEVNLIADEYGIEIGFETGTGRPVDTILKAADEGYYDLLVLGHNDLSGFWGRQLSDTTHRVTQQAPCSVLIIKSEDVAA